MTLHFSLPYRTTYGQRLVVAGSLPALGNWHLAGALPLTYDEATARWSGTLELPAAAPAALTYKYVLLLEGGGVVWEWGDNRALALPPATPAMAVRDYWRAPRRGRQRAVYGRLHAGAVSPPRPYPPRHAQGRPRAGQCRGGPRALCPGRAARGLGAAGVRAGLGPGAGQLG